MNTDISASGWAVDSGGGMAAGCGAGCAVYTVYAPILLAPGTVLIKCCDFQRSLLARSISDPSVLATRGAYVFIFSLCCLLSVCNVFITPRAGHQSRPLPLVFLQIRFPAFVFSSALKWGFLYLVPLKGSFCPKVGLLEGCSC